MSCSEADLEGLDNRLDFSLVERSFAKWDLDFKTTQPRPSGSPEARIPEASPLNLYMHHVIRAKLNSNSGNGCWPETGTLLSIEHGAWHVNAMPPEHEKYGAA